MNSREERQLPAELARLPRGVIDRFARPFARFLRIEAVGGAVLLLVTIGTVAISNSPWGPSFLMLWDTRVSVQVGSFG